MKASRCGSRRLECSNEHMESLAWPCSIEHRGPRIDVRGCAIDPIKTSGAVHPPIGGNDEHSRKDATYADHEARKEMQSRRKFVPSVKKESDENRFEKESCAFEGKRHPDDGSGVLHETGPKQTELETEHRAAHGTSGEEDGGTTRPGEGEASVLGIAGLQVSMVGDRHVERKNHRYAGKNDVKTKAQGHGASRPEEFVHGGSSGNPYARLRADGKFLALLSVVVLGGKGVGEKYFRLRKVAGSQDSDDGI